VFPEDRFLLPDVVHLEARGVSADEEGASRDQEGALQGDKVLEGDVATVGGGA
jgi:hypothetical protein